MDDMFGEECLFLSRASAVHVSYGSCRTINIRQQRVCVGEQGSFRAPEVQINGDRRQGWVRVFQASVAPLNSWVETFGTTSSEGSRGRQQ